jgi:hypothetical protein
MDESEPDVAQRACSGWIAKAPPRSFLCIGVTGQTEE